MRLRIRLLGCAADGIEAHDIAGYVYRPVMESSKKQGVPECVRVMAASRAAEADARRARSDQHASNIKNAPRSTYRKLQDTYRYVARIN